MLSGDMVVDGSEGSSPIDPRGCVVTSNKNDRTVLLRTIADHRRSSLSRYPGAEMA